MPKTASRIAKYLKPVQHFSRSVHLERDFADTTALDHYVVTDRIEQLFKQFSTAFRAGSTERAWRITGDYGTGKSCFALALARICEPTSARLPRRLSSAPKALKNANSIPVLVTGSSEPISVAIVRALQDCLDASTSRRKQRGLCRWS